MLGLFAVELHPGGQRGVGLAGAVLHIAQPRPQHGLLRGGQRFDQGFDTGDRRRRVALQQGFDNALLAADAARLHRHDLPRHHFCLVGMALHVVHAHQCLQRRQVLGHAQQPALDHRLRLRPTHRLHRQAGQPQVVRIAGGGQRRVQGVAGIVHRAQPLPGTQQRVQGAAIGRPMGQRQAQVRHRLVRTAGLQFHLTGQPAHRRDVATGLGQYALHCTQRIVQPALALCQLGDEGTQCGARRIQFDHPLERALGKGKVFFLQIRKTQREHHPCIVGQLLGRTGQQRQRAIALAAAHLHHAIDRQ